MLDPTSLAILGAISAGLGITKHLVSAIDSMIGACTHNTPAAAEWSSALCSLKKELIHAKDQLERVKKEIEPMRVKQGPGYEAANLERKELAFDGLLLELKKQLDESESQIRNSTAEFDQKRFPGWLLMEGLTTEARKAIAPITHLSRELGTIRLRIHEAREAILMTYMRHCFDHVRELFPTVESLGGIRDRLARSFLLPEPFCGNPGTDASLISGLLRCNFSEDTLAKLHERIHAMGSNWVSEARYEEKNLKSRSATAILDVLEKRQTTLLAQLDKGFFDPIINGDPLFTTNDIMTAVHGRTIMQTWRSILLGGGGGIMIALGGKVSAGKSSILNAMLGRPLLPTAQKLCTAVPCRIYHVSDQIEPSLSIPWIEPYKKALEWIQAEGLSKRYRDSNVPEERDMWAGFEERDSEGMDMLLRIEAKECPLLIQQTSGQAVAEQMNFLNHIIRICRTFRMEVDMGDPYQWPILSVEFTGLEQYRQDLSAPFSLLDLPGYNDNAAEDTVRFIDLMNRAAQQADVVVPVIAGPTIERGKSWSEPIIRPEWSTKIASVIITKLDLVGNRKRLKLPTIADMCEIPGRCDCISLCDTPQGMAAMQLQLRLDEIDRKYTILPDATAKTEPQLREEIKGVIEQLTNQEGSLYRLHNPELDPKVYEDFTMNNWWNLVEESLLSSQLRQTCDKFAENTIEQARRMRLSRFIGEIEPVLKGLILSLVGGLALSRASLSELHDTQREAERVLSEFQYVITKWGPTIDRVRTQQDKKLTETLTNFEQVARKHADETISHELQSLTKDGATYLPSRARDQEALLMRCRRAVQDRLNRDVEEVMPTLVQLWHENQDTVLKMSQVVLGIAKHPHLEAIITKTINGLKAVQHLDPEKIRIAVSGTPGEAAVGATNKGFWSRRLSKRVRPTSDPVATQAPNKTRAPTGWKQIFSRPRASQSSNSKHSSNISVPEEPLLPAGSSGEHPDGALPSSPLSSSLDQEKLAVVMRPASIAKYPGMGIPELQDSAQNEVNSDFASKGREGRDEGTMNPTHEFYELVLFTSFHPVISRVRTNAELCMTESLNEMAALAHQAVVDALEECKDTIEKQIEKQKSEDTKQLEAGTLERLTRWGNLVAALGAIDEMKQLKDEPVIRVMPSRPPGTIIHSPRSSFATPSTRSSSPSLSNRSLLSPI